MFRNNYLFNKDLEWRRIGELEASLMNSRKDFTLKKNLRKRFFIGVMLFITWLLLIPAIVATIWLLPNAKYVFKEPEAFVLDFEPEKYTLQEDITYEIKDIDGISVRQTITKGKTVYAQCRFGKSIVLDDRAGNRFIVSNPEATLGIEDYIHIPNIMNNRQLCIYTDSDIENLLIGESLEDVGLTTENVIQKKDGTKLVYFGSLSEKKDGIRNNGLTLLVNSAGIIQDYAFTGQSKKAGTLDFIPYISKIYDMSGISRLFRGIYKPMLINENFFNWDTEKPLLDELNIKWYAVAIIIIVLLLILCLFLVPAALIPFLTVMWIFLSKENMSNRTVYNLAKRTGLIVYLLAAFITLILVNIIVWLILVLPSVIFVFYYIIPELGREMDVNRCNNCGAWNSYYEQREYGSEYKVRTYNRYTNETIRESVCQENLLFHVCNKCGLKFQFY